jgi:hypothetical protein
MKRKAIFEEGRALLLNQPGHYCSHRAYEDGASDLYVRASVSSHERDHHLLESSPVIRRSVVDPKSLLVNVPDSRDPGIENLGTFFSFRQLNMHVLTPTTESLRRNNVDQEKDTDQFHDSSDSEDIYDLYNACNGILRNGLLDKGQLDEYSPDDAEALNVSKLREIWEHTASGCLRCVEIIRTLNEIRGTLRDEADEPIDKQAEEVDVDVIDSIS